MEALEGAGERGGRRRPAGALSTSPALRRAFPDRVVPFKRHHVRDLDRPVELPAHHRRHLRRASARGGGRGLRRADVSTWSEWIAAVRGAGRAPRRRPASARSRRAAFARQLALPGLVALRAERERRDGRHGAVVRGRPERLLPPGGLLRREGYEVSASYALFAVALDHLRERGVRRVDLGGPRRSAVATMTAWCASSAAGPTRSASPTSAAASSIGRAYERLCRASHPGGVVPGLPRVATETGRRMSDFAILGRRAGVPRAAARGPPEHRRPRPADGAHRRACSTAAG